MQKDCVALLNMKLSFIHMKADGKQEKFKNIYWMFCLNRKSSCNSHGFQFFPFSYKERVSRFEPKITKKKSPSREVCQVFQSLTCATTLHCYTFRQVGWWWWGFRKPIYQPRIPAVKKKMCWRKRDSTQNSSARAPYHHHCFPFLK